MKCDLRRKNIVNLLSESDKPVPAGKLAEMFGVSRQIIVKDIARIRSDGTEISALSRGYMLSSTNPFERVFKVKHADDEVEKELNMIVDSGGTVKDVFVYHKAYGIVSARLDINTRHDVQVFLEQIKTGKSSLLKNVTAGYHYHTITAKNEETLVMVEKALKENRFLAPLQEYEPETLNKIQFEV